MVETEIARFEKTEFLTTTVGDVVKKLKEADQSALIVFCVKHPDFPKSHKTFEIEDIQSVDYASGTKVVEVLIRE